MNLKTKIAFFAFFHPVNCPHIAFHLNTRSFFLKFFLSQKIYKKYTKMIGVNMENIKESLTFVPRTKGKPLSIKKQSIHEEGHQESGHPGFGSP